MKYNANNDKASAKYLNYCKRTKVGPERTIKENRPAYL